MCPHFRGTLDITTYEGVYLSIEVTVYMNECEIEQFNYSSIITM